MKQSLNEISTYTIQTLDYTKGKVKDILFDEERWIVRYIETDLTNNSSEKRKLIPKMFFKNPNWDEQEFPVELTKSDVESCPDMGSNLPISRKYEQELYKHFKEEEYWMQSYVSPMGIPAITHPIPPSRVSGKVIDEKKLKTHLRSFQEIIGYSIHALDGKLGQIDDIIVDDIDWRIIYAVVDTSTWMPLSKKVLVGVDRMSTISYADKEIKINVDSAVIKSAPEFDQSEPIDDEYEVMLYEYYNKK